MLRYGRISVVGHVADGDAVRGTIAQVDMVETGGPGGNQSHPRKLRQQPGGKVRMDGRTDDFSVGMGYSVSLVQGTS